VKEEEEEEENQEMGRIKGQQRSVAYAKGRTRAHRADWKRVVKKGWDGMENKNT